MKRNKNIWCAIVLGLALIFSGCGGDGGGKTSPTPDLPPPTPPPDPPTSGNLSIDKHFNMEEIAVATYKDNKQAAASYTFDDGPASSFMIADIFEGYGIRSSFYIIPGRISAPEDWAQWRNLASKGHEIGNHSLNHINLEDPALPDETLDREINEAQRVIEANIGIRPLVFAFPQNSYNDRSEMYAYQNHVATRLPGFNDPTYRRMAFLSSTSVEEANDALNSAVNVGGWFVPNAHGVDGDGWEPITSTFLRDHLEHALGNYPGLWIDTFFNIARYRLCREQATLEASVTSPYEASIKLEGNDSPSLCTMSLTVTVPIIKMPEGALLARNAQGVSVPAVQSEGKLVFDLRPGEEIRLQIAR